MVEWRRFQPTDDFSVLNEIERVKQIVFPISYRQTVKAFNHGIPSARLFVAGSIERMIDRLISISPSSHPNVLDAIDWVDQTETGLYIPFALDPFGSLVCFRFKSNTEYDVVYIDHETGDVVNICNSFDNFIDHLY